MLMYAEVSLSLVVSQDEGSLGDQQWFLSVGHVLGVGSGRDSLDPEYIPRGRLKFGNT